MLTGRSQQDRRPMRLPRGGTRELRWHFRCLLLAALLLPSAGTSKPHSRGLLAYTRSLSACLDGGDAIDGALCALQQLGPYLSQAIDTRSDGAASHRKRITHELRGLLHRVEAHWSELKEEKSQPRRLLADITTSARLESLSSACNISASSKPEARLPPLLLTSRACQPQAGISPFSSTRHRTLRNSF